jgi:hypothetical protein
MKSFFRLLFSPILVAWWLIKLLVRILALPVTIVWRILRMIAPEATRLVDGPVNALKEIFRLR